MSTQPIATPAARSRSRFRSPRPGAPRRVDQPSFGPGQMVWWRAGLYKVEHVEFQGQGWMAVLVQPADFGSPGARCWFAPCRQLQLEQA